MKTLKRSLLILMLLIGSVQARAEKMDSETQNSVIERLDRVLSMMDKTDASWATSSVRLADLLAERARLRFMAEIEAGCKGCKGSDADRKRSISLYESVSNKSKKIDQGVVYFQLAHLYNMEGDKKKAIELFNRVIKSKSSFGEELAARANEGLADIYFQDGNAKLSQEHYEKALASKTTTNRGLLTYRVAWCEFNQDHLKSATTTLEKLLEKPETLTKDSANGPVYDAALHEDVVRDLATFYARGQIKDREIQRYMKFSPEAQRKDLLLFFANEASRVGQKKAAGQIYQAYMKEKLTQEERLDALVSSAQVQYDMGLAYQSTEDFALAAKTLRETGCKAEKCEELQKRMRRYVTELHRSKKTKVTPDVIRAYATYISTFPEDAEMAGLGAQVAMDLKLYGDAIVLYHQAGVSAHRTTMTADFAKMDAKEQKKVQTLKMTGIMGEIEAAELSKDPKAREKAYINYLALMPNGEKQFEIRYQLAQLAYENKNWAQAAQEFETLALDKTGNQDLRKKSADLALDCLAMMKADAEIEKWAQNFAQALPAHRDEFLKLSRKAVINQVAVTANSDSSSSGELKSALGKLRAMNMNGASDVEKTLHYKNEAVLAQKTDDGVALMAALNGLLAVKTLSAQDREETLARKVGYYEQRMEFKSAYQTAKLMKFSGKSAAERELRLGTLAELAGLSPVKHYEAFLKASPRSAQGNFIRGRLVSLSSNQLKELNKYKNDLTRDPQLLSQLVLVIYAKNPKNVAAVQPFLKMKGVAKTPAAKLIAKQPFYREHAEVAHKIAAHKISNANQNSLKRTIQERVKLLALADQSLKKAMGLNDYTAQIISLNTVARENFRLVSDILSLPAPKGLNANLQKQYAALLKQQALPYMNKAQVADGKLQEFWANTQARENLAKDYENAQKDMKSLLGFEIRVLASVAPDSIRAELVSVLKAREPGSRELLSARQAAIQNPRDPQVLQNLKALETKMGNPVMANYLDNRLNRNQSSEVL